MSTAMKAGRAGVVAAALALGVPAAAQAAGPPGVTTGGISAKTTSTVTLNGRVNPNGKATRYHFEYGPTSDYGILTPTVELGGGTSTKKVSAAIVGLAPATKYHYRLIAENSFGIRRGGHRTFKTAREPLGLTLSAAPNPVFVGADTAVSGQLYGTGNAWRAVQLQLDTFPYDGFVNAYNPILTDAGGLFSWPVLDLPANTYARVLMVGKPEVVSPVITLQALVRVRTHVKVKKRRRGARKVRFSGTVRPAIDGEQLQLQRLVKGTWQVVRTMRAKHRRSGTSSKYAKRLRVRRTSRFRVFATVSSGAYTSTPGRVVKVKVRRRPAR